MTEPADELRDETYADPFSGQVGTPLLPVNGTSVKYTNAIVVKSGGGILFGFSGYNSNVAAQFILVFDAQSVPSNGAVPVVVLAVPGTFNFSADWSLMGSPRGRAFARGIVICNSSTGPTLTIGAADCWFDVQVL